MNHKIRAMVLLVFWAGGAMAWLAATEGTGPQRWRGVIHLLQGGEGTIEFTLENTVIQGTIVIPVGDRLFETPIQGRWQQRDLFFRRTLSPTSEQPFQGIVTPVDETHVRMEGRYAAGFHGSWTGECERLERREPSRDSGNARRAPPPPVSGKKETVAAIIPLEIEGRDGLRAEIISWARPGLLLDFVAGASKAKWTNAWLELGFPGDPANPKGYARLEDQALMEDGKIYPRILETHPHRQPRGMITGRYADVTIPAAGAEFRAGLGFRQGASGTDGVYYEIRCEFPGYAGIPVRREYHKTYNQSVATDFSQDLSRFAGLKGMVILSVNAGKKSADHDRAGWIEPALISLEQETRFASFVGGAIGSARNGDALTNAWGGKSGQLFGTVVLYLSFAHVDRPYPVRIESYQGDSFLEAKDLGSVDPGHPEIWATLARNSTGEWRERVIFNGTYVGDLRYTIAKGGE